MKRTIKKAQKIENVNLIRKISWSFTKTTGLEYDDLFSEATLAYYEAKTTYKEDTGTKYTTFVWVFITNWLINYIKRQKHLPTRLPENFELPSRMKYVESFENVIKSWPVECQDIAKFVIMHADSFDNMSGREVRGLLRYILPQYGWKVSTVNSAISKMKDVLDNTAFTCEL